MSSAVAFGTPSSGTLTSAQSRFRAGARITTLADADLYGGKLCAALDRQHPRDLFDVRLLLRNEGITPAIRRAFVVYLASHTRPMHELLQPNLIDITDAFERQFIGMTLDPVTIDELVDARHDLVEILVPSLDDSEKTFLLSMKSGDPDWGVLGIEGSGARCQRCSGSSSTSARWMRGSGRSSSRCCRTCWARSQSRACSCLLHRAWSVSKGAMGNIWFRIACSESRDMRPMAFFPAVVLKCFLRR